MLLLALLALTFIYVGHRTLNLTQNYLAARRIGLPIIVLPVSWQDPIWAIFHPRLSFLRNFPFCSWYLYSGMGWSLHDRYETHRKLGGAFTLVSPGRNQIVLVSSENTKEVLAKYKRWTRPQELYSMFNTFGENVDTVNGEDWQRHRKIVNVGFHEKNLVKVWDEARSRAQLWLKTVSENSGENTRDLTRLHDDSNAISAGVLMEAVFGQSNGDSEASTTTVPKGHKWSFNEAMHFMVSNVILAWMMRSMKLPKFLEPKKLKDFWQRQNDLQLYLEEMVAEPKSDFVQALVDANESEKKTGARAHLSREELYGNMFVLQLAGFDTTSYAIFQSLCALALDPDMQEWARPEKDVAEYGEGFEQAVRIRAVMYETIRYYGLTPSIARCSPNTEHMTVNGKNIVIPPNTYVAINYSGQSHDPHVWGDDAAVWRPQRWIETVNGVETLDKALESEFLMWSYGPRICPGKKFSQVEFTAVISKLLADFRLEASSTLQGVLDDFGFKVAPAVNRPDQAWVKFIKR